MIAARGIANTLQSRSTISPYPLDVSNPLLQLTNRGLYCAAGTLHRPVAAGRAAVVTHAHSDHAYRGCQHYLAARAGERVLRVRLGDDIALHTLDYGEAVALNGVRLSLHPAGHILGSAQVRVESGGEVWVVSGDYKLEADATCPSLSRFAVRPLSPNRLSGCQSTVGRRRERSSRRFTGGGAAIRLPAVPVYCSVMPWANRSTSWPCSIRASDQYSHTAPLRN